MADDAAMARWTAQLLDQRRALAVPVFGHLRSRGWAYEERTLSEHMLHFVTSGGHAGHVNGVPVRTRTDALLWVPPGIRQHLAAVRGPQPLGMYYVRFTLAGSLPPLEGPYVREGMGDAYALFVRLYHECAADLRGREESIRALLALIFSAWRRADLQRARFSQTQRSQVIALADRHLAHRLHPTRLAQALGMAPARFARGFSATFGCAPRTWLMQQRIRRAAERLLEDRASIGEIALAFGYRDLFLFSRQFKQVMGTSPRRWRLAQG